MRNELHNVIGGMFNFLIEIINCGNSQLITHTHLGKKNPFLTYNICRGTQPSFDFWSIHVLLLLKFPYFKKLYCSKIHDQTRTDFGIHLGWKNSKYRSRYLLFSFRWKRYYFAEVVFISGLWSEYPHRRIKGN